MKKAAPALPGNETTPFDQRHEDSNSGLFGQRALEFVQVGLLPVPVGGDDGKAALIRWSKTSRKQAIALSHQPKFAAANIGFITGKESGVTILDLDKADELLRIGAENHFGRTPLIVRTAGGKWHLYYAYDGERRRIRPFGNAVPLDLLGDGGYCLAPPSVIGDGAYCFWRGSLADIARLPKINPGALDAFEGHQAMGDPYNASRSSGPARPKQNSSPPSSTLSEAIRRLEQQPAGDRRIEEGQRNDACFKRGLHLARGIHDRNGSQEDLVQQLLEWNRQNCTPPLDRREVEQVAGHCWEKTLSGRNWVGTGDPWYEMARLARSDLENDAFRLLVILRDSHKPRATFAVSPEGLEQAGVIPGWNKKRYRKARNQLEAAGLVICTHRGGSGKGDPSLFRIGSAGTISAPNRNSHPSSAAAAASQNPFEAPERFSDVERDLLGDAVPALLDAVTFGATVKRLRAERGWTVEQLAGMAGLARPTLTNIEQGRYPTTVGRQQRILACLQAAQQAVA